MPIKDPATVGARPRIRISELLGAKGMTPYYLATRSGDRLSLNWVYRLVRADGYFRQLTPDQLTALADVLGVPVGYLFTTNKPGHDKLDPLLVRPPDRAPRQAPVSTDSELADTYTRLVKALRKMDLRQRWNAFLDMLAETNLEDVAVLSALEDGLMKVVRKRTKTRKPAKKKAPKKKTAKRR